MNNSYRPYNDNIKLCLDFLNNRYRVANPTKKTIKKKILEFKEYNIYETMAGCVYKNEDLYSLFMNIFNTTSNYILWINLLNVLIYSNEYDDKDIYQLFCNLFHKFNNTMFEFNILFDFIKRNITIFRKECIVIYTIKEKIIYKTKHLIVMDYSIKHIIEILEKIFRGYSRYELLNIVNNIYLERSNKPNKNNELVIRTKG